ncbi:MAG: hypothetical protein JXB85_14940 [Anaerolineales bacterium]|nr:hypothetical protein [Anaerolineales bacterium]
MKKTIKFPGRQINRIVPEGAAMQGSAAQHGQAQGLAFHPIHRRLAALRSFDPFPAIKSEAAPPTPVQCCRGSVD